MGTLTVPQKERPTFDLGSIKNSILAPAPVLPSPIRPDSLPAVNNYKPQLEYQMLNYQSITDSLIMEEGSSKRAYKDSLANPTIGIGVRMNIKGGKELIEKVGGNYEELLTGKAELTDQQEAELFQLTMDRAVRETKEIFPNIENYSPRRQAALIGLTFQLGQAGLKDFPKMVEAVKGENWKEGADQLLWNKGKMGKTKTPYFTQVPNRARRYYDMLATGN